MKRSESRKSRQHAITVICIMCALYSIALYSIVQYKAVENLATTPTHIIVRSPPYNGPGPAIVQLPQQILLQLQVTPSLRGFVHKQFHRAVQATSHEPQPLWWSYRFGRFTDNIQPPSSLQFQATHIYLFIHVHVCLFGVESEKYIGRTYLEHFEVHIQ